MSKSRKQKSNKKILSLLPRQKSSKKEQVTEEQIITWLHEKQNRKSAIACIALLRENKNNIGILNLLAINLSILEKYRFAEQAFSKLCELEPTNLGYLKNWAVAATLGKNLVSAVQIYERIIKIEPQNPESYFKIINICQRLNNHELATKYATQASLLIKSQGNTCYEQGDYQQALQLFQQASNLFPTDSELYNNLACVYQHFNQLNDAMTNLRKAISYSPNNIEAHLNLGITLLKLGNFVEGWREYEWRLQKPNVLEQLKRINIAPWSGESLEGKTLIIFAEQGLGDVIQFSRYIPLINKGSGKIILACSKPLIELMRTLPNCDDVIDMESATGKADAYAFLVSLPLIFSQWRQDIPANIPYLAADPTRVLHLASYFAMSTPTLKIGFCWQAKAGNLSSIERSCSLHSFLELIQQHPQIQFYCLQKDIQDTEFSGYDNVVNLSNQLGDFADTAAVISHLDLVISIDTSIVHLAGALNKPVWVLLPFAADWRWLIGRNDSPWYPSMRLYRQINIGDWNTVFSHVTRDLLDYAH